MLHRGLIGFGLVALLAVGSAAVAAPPAPPSPQHGAELAKRWCAACHVVSADQTRASSDAPSFFALTGEAARTPEALAAFLTMPSGTHVKMPDLHLSRVEVDDIVAYVVTLKK